jgi:hypothetical protein
MNRYLFTILFLGALSLPSAHAEIYKHVDSEGNVTYSNVKIKGAKKLDLEPADTSFGGDGSAAKRAPAPKAASPAGFPKVDSGTQNARDTKRKEILQTELDSERAALEKAKQAYAEAESNPEVYKTKDGKTFRNMAKYEEKLKPLREEIEAHERNIELLQKEIGGNN